MEQQIIAKDIYVPTKNEEKIQYYVVRSKDTGFYFRGKGVNRWGKHFNQATIYRIKGTAEESSNEITRRGEKTEVVPIYICEQQEYEQTKEKIVKEIYFGLCNESIWEKVKNCWLNLHNGTSEDLAAVFEEITGVKVL